jgi:hypothetical protein
VTATWGKAELDRAVILLDRIYPARSSALAVLDAVGLGQRPDVRGAAVVREMWERALAAAEAADLVPDLLAEALHDEAAAAFRPTISRLLGARAGLANARYWRRHGMPADERADRIVDSIAAAVAGPPASGLIGELQAITTPTAGMLDTRSVLDVFEAARRRVAMVEIGGQSTGTGVLVGPDMLLTAGHVVDGASWPTDPTAGSEVRARFDYEPAADQLPAATGIRVDVVELMCASPPTRGEQQGQMRTRDWERATAGELDFALLRLAMVPPEGAGPRGFFPLDAASYTFGDASLVMVGHPLGQFQKTDLSPGIPWQNHACTRVRYRGNSFAGSSGSAVIDLRGRLVALHHYSEHNANQGVPISAIAAALGPRLLDRLRAAAAIRAGAAGDPVRGRRAPIRLDGLPLVNRKRFSTSIDRLVLGDGARQLLVTGEPGSGVSYSFQLASYLAAQTAKTVRVQPPWKLDLRKYRNVPAEERWMQVVGALTLRLGMRRIGDPLAQEARDATTLQAWLEQHLAGTDQQWWIFVDSIDELAEVAAGGLTELLALLMDISRNQAMPLRVILAGRAADKLAPALVGGLVPDRTSGLTRPDVEEWLRAAAGELTRPIDEVQLQVELAAMALPATGGDAVSMQLRLSEVLLKVVR